MDVHLRARQLKKLVRDLQYWKVRDWHLVDGWAANGRPLGPNEVWATARQQYLLSCQTVSIPEDWPVDEAYLEISAFGYGTVKLSAADGTTHVRPLNEYSRTFSLPGRCCAVEASIAPIRDRTVGFATIGDRWLARIVWLDSVVEYYCRLIAYTCSLADLAADMQLREDLIRMAEDAIANSVLPSATASHVSRVSHNENLRRHWSAVRVMPHPEPLTISQRTSLETAAELLAENLSKLKLNSPIEGSAKLYGYAHTDVEWLWPEHITIPAIIGQFGGAIAQLQRYPDFRFGQAGSHLYAILEEREPQLFAQLSEHVSRGRWELLTGTCVEPDANMLSGESLIRQLLHGQSYFESRFGKRSKVCWLPDTFGFSGALPQILAGSGLKYFFTTRLWQAVATGPHPGCLFTWEGIDGTRILGYVGSSPEGYQFAPTVESVAGVWRTYPDRDLHAHMLQPVGYANGIGPTDEDIEAALTLGSMPGLPEVEFTSAEDFFAAADEATQERSVPIWRGELYLEGFRGTFTTQGRTKVLHRRAEACLTTAETAMAMRTFRTGQASDSLTEVWHRLLRKQSHDVIAGTCIREVHEGAEREFLAIGDQAQTLTAEALTAIAADLPRGGTSSSLLFANPTLSWRQVRGVVPGWRGSGQQVRGGAAIAATQLVPPMSVIWDSQWATSGVTAQGTAIENDLVRVKIGDNGTLTSLFDKRLNKELLRAPGNDIRAYLDRPFYWDAWELASNYRRFVLEAPRCTSVEVIESGPHRASVAVMRTFRDSNIRQEVRLWAGSARVDFATSINWHERRVILRAYFPTTIESRYATFECAHGTIRRPTRWSSAWDEARFEVPAHRFVDLSAGDGGIALLNNGRYGHCVESGTISLSLLRSPVFPDPLADEGKHSLCYSIYPHTDGWLQGGVLAEALDLNSPLPCIEVNGLKDGIWQALSVKGVPIALGAFKGAQRAPGLVLRAYEPAGQRGTAGLELPPGWGTTAELSILEDHLGPPQFTFGPYQIRTWRVEAI